MPEKKPAPSALPDTPKGKTRELPLEGKEIAPKIKEAAPLPKEKGPAPKEEDLIPEPPKSKGGTSTSAEEPSRFDRGSSSIRSTSAYRPDNDRPVTPLQANWSAALHPEALGSGGDLRTVSYEERSVQQLPTALDGYCPVELCEHERWVAGDSRYKSVYGGRTFLFSGPDHQQRFLAAPARYAPVWSGDDPVLMVERHHRARGLTQHSAIYHGQLYMFSSATTLAKFREHPERYAKAKTHAE